MIQQKQLEAQLLTFKHLLKCNISPAVSLVFMDFTQQLLLFLTHSRVHSHEGWKCYQVKEESSFIMLLVDKRKQCVSHHWRVTSTDHPMKSVLWVNH